MSPLELLGASLLYVGAVLLVAIVATVIVARRTENDHSGLAGIIPIIYTWGGTLLFGAALGLFLLGGALL